ncbi:MAG: efflux RND transporter periplasmic adaptor subunit [Terriglobia bacterium]
MRAREFTAGALILSAVSLASCHHEEAYQKPLTPVSVRTVEAYSGASGVRYSGNVEPHIEVTVAFKVGGYVEEIFQVRGVDRLVRNVQEGDAVSRGTVLARVRERDYAEKVNQAKAQVAQAEASAEKAGLDFDRASTLFASQSLTKPEYDAAKAQRDSASATLAGARAQLAEAETALADCSVRAPMNGIILKRAVELGSLVGPGTAAFTLADTNFVKVVFGVPDVVLPKVRRGQTLTVTTEALRGKEFHGQVTVLAPSADLRSRVFDVELLVDNSGGLLKPGMIAALELPAEPLRTPVPAVPLAAIIRPQGDANGYAAVVVEDQGDKQIARVRKIALGEAYGNTITVASGVRPGERVIVTGATVVSDGEQVRIIP